MATRRKITPLNLKAQYHSIKSEIDQAVMQVLDQGTFSGGRSISQFEKMFAQAHGSKYCIAVNSGTSALHAIILALEIGSGDEVIVPTNTCFPTPEAIRLTGAIPKFVDCEDKYYNIDPLKIEQAVTSRTRAIMAVHLYGQPAQLEEIKHIANKCQLYLLEDCAQAHLATYDRKLVGNFGIASAFSFYPTKNLGAFGEGGAVLCNDLALTKKIRMLINHGSSRKNHHELIGHNYRMDTLQAAILSVKLEHLDDWTNRRRQNAQLYHNQLSNVTELTLPKEAPRTQHSYHQYVVRLKQRDRLKEYLNDREVSTMIHYPIPCHLQKAFVDVTYEPLSLPVSEQHAHEVLSLPIHDQIQEEDVNFVADCIKSFYTEYH